MCSPCAPCGPMVCYKYEDCGPPKGANKKPTEVPGAEEEGAEKKDKKENPLKRIKSRELRGGIMYYSCHCIKRNGLQHDCRRTGCGGEPACLVLPDPVCAPAQLARARGLADPAPFAKHISAVGGGGGSSSGPTDSGSGSGKKFIVCELKGIMPDMPMADNKGGNKCCKCPAITVSNPTPGPQASSQASASVPDKGCKCLAKNLPYPTPTSQGGPQACLCPVAQPISKINTGSKGCTCQSGPSGTTQPVIRLDEKIIKDIFASFGSKTPTSGSGSKNEKPNRRDPRSPPKEEPCTRPGCIHWKPPPPCVWDLPCKADCFETPPGIQPGRNPLTGGGGSFSGGSPGRNASGDTKQPREKIKLLTPDNCTGCCSGNQGPSTSSGPAPGLPVMVMKLC